MNYRLSLRIGRKKTNFYGPIFLLPVEDKSVLRLKNRSRTNKTDDFSSPDIYFFHCFSEKIRLDVSSESSAGQRIHMKNQALFSSKDKSKQEMLQYVTNAPEGPL